MCKATQLYEKIVLLTGKPSKMIVELISFSYNSNNIPNANYLIDVRFLNNPFYIDELRGLTGLDKEVINFFKDDTENKTFIKELCRWIEYILKVNKKTDKIVIGIGCTGGQHRSPYIVECLGNYLLKKKLAGAYDWMHQMLHTARGRA